MDCRSKDTPKHNVSSGDASIDTDAFVDAGAAVPPPETIIPEFYDCQTHNEAAMSDTPKHTPGPWEYHKMPQSGYIVFQTWDVPTAGYVKTEADAQLIAAAPEMLEALKKIKTVLESGQVWDRTAGIMMIDEVVAKAEGRQG